METKNLFATVGIPVLGLVGLMVAGKLNPGSHHSLRVDYKHINSSVDTMEKAKREEWEAKGYRPGLIDKALLWASEWTEGMIKSPLYSMLSSEIREKAAVDLYKTGLDRGERWIQAFEK